MGFSNHNNNRIAMADQDITKEILNFLFDYKDGELYWKFSLSSKSPKGCLAGSIKNDRYRAISINKKSYLCHRLIYMMFHGYMPKFVDHIDNNRLNNRIENLREATHSENMRNKKLPVNNTSGYKNVTWNKRKRKWAVALKIKDKSISCGYFVDIELADLVAQEARDKYHKEFARSF
jgi:hypothetical protein